MNDLVPAHWSLATPNSSRPTSDVQSGVSWDTERPDSSITARQSFTREIDHIKSLISLSSGSGITAQVFRRKPTSNEQSSKDQIIRELDQLKRKIKSADTAAVAAAAAAAATKPQSWGPEGSIRSPVNATDGRDEELDKMRTELIGLRQQREAWLQQAETRINLSDPDTARQDLTHSQIQDRLAAAEKRYRDGETLIELKDAALAQMKEEANLTAKYHQDALNNLRKSHEDALQATKHDNDDRVQHLRDDYKQKRERMLAGHKAALAQATLDSNARLEVALSSNPSATESISLQEHERQVENLQRQLREIQRTSSLTLTAATPDGSTVAGPEDFDPDRPNDAHPRPSAELAKLKLKHEKLQVEKDSAVKQAQNDAQSRYRILEDSHRAALREMRNSYDEQLTQVQQNHQTNLLVAQGRQQGELENYERQLEEARAVHQAEMEVLQAEHRQTVAGLKADLVKTGEAINDLEAFATEEIARLKVDHDRRALEMENMWSARLQDLEEVHQAELQTAAEDAARDAARSRQAFQRQIADVEARSYSIDESGEDQIAEAHEAMLAARNALQATERVLHEREQELDDLQEKLHASERVHGQELSRVRDTLNRELESLKTGATSDQHENIEHLKHEHQAALLERDARHEQALEMKTKIEQELTNYQEKQSQHEAELERLHADHTLKLDSLHEEQTTAAQRYAEHLARLEDSLKMAQTDHRREIEALQDAHADSREDTYPDESSVEFTTPQQSPKVPNFPSPTSIQDIERMRKLHEEELAAVRHEAQETLEKAQAEHETWYSSIEADLHNALVNSNDKVANLEAQHAEILRRLEGEQEAHIETLRQDHEDKLVQAMKAHERAQEASDEKWRIKFAEHKSGQPKVFNHAIRNSDASLNDKLNVLRQQHAETMEKAIEDVRAEAKSAAEEPAKLHEVALEKAVREATEAGRAELDAFKASHDEVLMHGRTMDAERDEKQLEELSAKHKAALDAAIATAQADSEAALKAQAASHSVTLATELSKVRAELEHAQEESHELTSTRESMHAEVADLRARLDAELTAHAEAERALAILRKQRATERRQSGEWQASLHKQIADLREEKENLSEKHRHSISSLMELQPKSPLSPVSPFFRKNSPFDPDDPSMEMVTVKRQLVVAEQERREAQELAQKKIDELSEKARQNEFLVKEVESLMAQLNASKEARWTSGIDAAAQTDPPIATLNESRSRSQPPTQPQARYNGQHGRSRSAAPRFAQVVTIPENFHEQKADVETSRAMKAQQRSGSSQPKATRGRSRTASNSTQLKDSFNNYLQRAQAELTELVNANEQLFAQKVLEHVGDVQRAKTRLTAEYKAKADALIATKERRERDAVAKGAAEFARERTRLLAKQNSNNQDADTVRMAEERLVTDFNRKVSKKNSAIALRHAADYQTLTKDYDRRIAELVEDQQYLESDMSHEASQSEQERTESRGLTPILKSSKRASDSDDIRPPTRGRQMTPKAQPSSPSWPTPAGDHESEIRSRSTKRQDRSLTATPRASHPTSRTLVSVPYPFNRLGMEDGVVPSRPGSERSRSRATSTSASHWRMRSEQRPPVPEHSAQHEKILPEAIKQTTLAPVNSSAPLTPPFPSPASSGHRRTVTEWPAADASLHPVDSTGPVSSDATLSDAQSHGQSATQAVPSSEAVKPLPGLPLRGPPSSYPVRTSSKPLPWTPKPVAVQTEPTRSISSNAQLERIKTGRTSEPRAAHTIKTYPLPPRVIPPPPPGPSAAEIRRARSLKHSSGSIYRFTTTT